MLHPIQPDFLGSQPNRRPQMRYRWFFRWLSMVVAIGAIATGCDAPKVSDAKGASARKRLRVVAQGQIQPADGMIRLAATPGDVVEEIQVEIDQVVSADQTLAVMRSQKLRQAQLDALKKRYTDAVEQRHSAIETAQLRVAAAELKRDQVDAQQASLTRQRGILELAQQQVDVARRVFDRLKGIAEDPLTKGFIGQIELDRQQAQVADAELRYQQESEKLLQATESVQWSRKVAEQELAAARSGLRLVESGAAIEAIAAEMKSLEVQNESSYLKSPCLARVVAINGRVGEAAGQFPLIELADESNLICAAEVSEADAAEIKAGLSALLTSPALRSKSLKGKVLRRERMVGRPQLPSADPLALADYRSSRVVMEIDAADRAEAARWLNLQVTVEIQLEPEGTPSKPTSSATPQSETSMPTGGSIDSKKRESSSSGSP